MVYEKASLQRVIKKTKCIITQFTLVQKNQKLSGIISMESPNIERDIDFILSHFDNSNGDDNHNLFPRKMMTDLSNGQFTVYSKEEVLLKCTNSKYIDCRINAYPEYTHWKKYCILRHPPNFIFIDLDLANFSKYKNPRKMLDKVLEDTLKNISLVFLSQDKRCSPIYQSSRSKQVESAEPTVLWSGNGYHIYLPIKAIILDEYATFSRDKFPYLFSGSKYIGYSVSELFLIFAKNYLTNGKADFLHRPKYKSCLIRIPNTFNSKCLAHGFSYQDSKIRLIQEWNGYRPPIQLVIKHFRRWLIQEEINERLTIKRYRSHTNSTISLGKNIEWIETLINTPIGDHRKYCLWRILIPYLINVKKIDKDSTFRYMEGWLANCDEVQKLQFNHQTKIKENIKYVKDYLPISKNKLKDENPELYNLLT
jgi:hypothetical protein